MASRALRGAPIAMGIATATMFVIAALWLRARLEDGADVTEDGQANALMLEAAPLLRGHPPSQAAVDALLARARDRGMTYLAFVDDQAVLAQTGVRLGDDAVVPPPAIVRGRSWARAVHQVPPPPPGEHLPPGHAPPSIVVEFVPSVALSLRREAALVVPAALVLACLLVGAGVAISRALRQREDMAAEIDRARTLATLGEMSAILAHEIKNPLASAKGHAQLLEEALAPGTSEAASAARVVGDLVRLEALTRDLLELVRTGELRRVTTDPAELLRACADEVGGDVRVDVRTSAKVALDAPRLRQALVNVLRNAVQATPAGGPAPVATVERSGGELVFLVRDSGAGFAGEPRRLFAPFYTTKARGVGLGLAIARRIVELHGGTIAARNHPTGGAELRLVLPAASVEHPPLSAAEAA